MLGQVIFQGRSKGEPTQYPQGAGQERQGREGNLQGMLELSRWRRLVGPLSPVPLPLVLPFWAEVCEWARGRRRELRDDVMAVDVSDHIPAQERIGVAGVGERRGADHRLAVGVDLSLIHISEPTRLGMISYAV